MRKLYGLATLIGVAAGAAYYLTKVGAVSISDEEQEDGSRKFSVELKMPKVKKAEVEEEFDEEEDFEEEFDEEIDDEEELEEEEEELDEDEEPDGEEEYDEDDESDEEEEFDEEEDFEEEEEERKIGFTFEIGADTNEKINEVKEKAIGLKDNAVEAAQGLKATILNAVNKLMKRGEETEEASPLEEVVEDVKETVEEGLEAAEEAVDAAKETVEEAVEEVADEIGFELPEIEQEMPEVEHSSLVEEILEDLNDAE